MIYSIYKPINEVSSINVLANKGVVGDRHFKEFNDPYNQLTLIESENIDYYNIKYSLNIPYVDFRRNIITKGIKLIITFGVEKVFPLFVLTIQLSSSFLTSSTLSFKWNLISKGFNWLIKLLIFDEPFSGFDPINASIIRKEILSLRDNGTTIIFSTHRMESVEEICDHIALINNSKTILEGSVSQIQNDFKSTTFECLSLGYFL